MCNIGRGLGSNTALAVLFLSLFYLTLCSTSAFTPVHAQAQMLAEMSNAKVSAEAETPLSGTFVPSALQSAGGNGASTAATASCLSSTYAPQDSTNRARTTPISILKGCTITTFSTRTVHVH